jgi:predicted transglutaminase-like cysteine proteinase|nr:transglutaminase-like cysteine peptidase [Neorhizobium tomejilense]
MLRKNLGVVFLLAAFPQSVSVAAEPAHMTLAGRSNPPIGYFEFCNRTPDECGTSEEAKASYNPTPSQWADIRKLNAEINKAITHASDEELYSKEEWWTYPEEKGDTEDYALLKQRRLKEYGVPPAALLLTVAIKRNGDGHALLTMITSDGDFILDDETDEILPWRDAPYTMLKRQTPSNSLRWVRVDDPD